MPANAFIDSATKKFQAALPPNIQMDDKTSQTFMLAVIIVMVCLLVSCISSSIWSSIRSSSSEEFKNVEQKKQRTHYRRF
jgi:hypothetical protein